MVHVTDEDIAALAPAADRPAADLSAAERKEDKP